MKKWHLAIIAGVLASIIIALGIANVKCNDAFWSVTAFDCLSLLVVVGVSFFIVERQTDKRKQKELFITLLEALKVLVEDKASYNFEGVSREEVLMRMREIRLKLRLVEKYSERFGIKNDHTFLNEKFEEYQTIIDDHTTDMKLLSQLHKELYRPLNLMSQRIFQIMIALYD